MSDLSPKPDEESTRAYQPPPVLFPGERFPPGTVLADRYRILIRLGKGGMGEVYLAYDQKLEETVALKFLPAHLEHDSDRKARLRKEVALARRVSNEYCCRVHDIGEHQGLTFLTMEYIDGNDLHDDLRRVGRLPEEKALQVARQLCQALGAVHDKGLLHRDLKPANVMMDRKGKVKLADFGLAAAGRELSASEFGDGTPAYQAPEQLKGESVDERSDLFALGLILYELFTGKRPFLGTTRQELLRCYDSGPPSTPSSVIVGLGERVDRIILRCLAKDPNDRPRSAYEVLAALPGGDPIQDAIAKGETPSPQAVRDSDGVGSLSLLRGGLLLAAVLVGLAAAVWLQSSKLVARVPLPKSPDVLIDKARDFLKQQGHGSFRDSAYGFDHDSWYLKWIEENDRSPNRWDALGESPPAALYFWYRQSPSPLVPALYSPYPGAIEPGRITWHDPPPFRSGMAAVKLDPKGRLLEFQAVPPEKEVPRSADAPVPDWRPLFQAAGLDLNAFEKSTAPTLTPPVYADKRESWTGVLPGHPDIPIRIEAAAYCGQPVYFQIVAPWTRRDDREALVISSTFAPSIGRVLAFIIPLGMAVVLVPLNLRRGRADREGASRLAYFVFGLFLMVWVFETRHVPGLEELSLLIMGLACALYWAALCWLGYVALEPYARRLWPEILISWGRLLAGRWRDPRVGRDLLIGVGAGVSWYTLLALARLVPLWARQEAPVPYWDWWITSTFVNGYWMGSLLCNTAYAIWGGLFDWLLFLILFRALFRKPWLAAVLYAITFTVLYGPLDRLPPLSWPFVGSAMVLGIVVLVRFGVLAVITMYLIKLTLEFPITTDFSLWYARDGLWALGFVLALAVYGFWVSLDRRPLAEV